MFLSWLTGLYREHWFSYFAGVCYQRPLKLRRTDSSHSTESTSREGQISWSPILYIGGKQEGYRQWQRSHHTRRTWSLQRHKLFVSRGFRKNKLREYWQKCFRRRLETWPGEKWPSRLWVRWGAPLIKGLWRLWKRIKCGQKQGHVECEWNYWRILCDTLRRTCSGFDARSKHYFHMTRQGLKNSLKLTGFAELKTVRTICSYICSDHLAVSQESMS